MSSPSPNPSANRFLQLQNRPTLTQTKEKNQGTMTSLIPRSDGSKTRIDGKVWDMIFIDTKTKKSKKKATITTEPTAPIKAEDLDIRKWSFGDRKLLVSKGDRANVFIGDKQITTISKPLLRATSSITKDILKDGAVKLPEDTDKDGVCRLVSYLESIIQADTRPLPFPRHLSMAASLSVCAAAAALGMKKYVVHLYKKCEALLRKDLPAYEDIDAIIAFKEAHFRLFKFVVEGLVVHVFENTVPDPEDFALYLAQNPVLDNAINMAIEKRRYELRKAARLEKGRVQQERTQARHESWVKEMAEREAKKLADEKAFFDAKAKKDAELEKSVQEKMRASDPKKRKFTPEETAHYWRRYNRKPPKGC